MDRIEIRTLGSIRVTGFTGQAPRDARRVTELLALLAAKRCCTGSEVSAALSVSMATVRSMTAHLRGWIGENAHDVLPPAYDGHYRLSARVWTDWEHLRILLGVGAPNASPDALQAALTLVDGAPMADARPGTYGWADSLRIDITQLIRDASREVARRATNAGDLDRARWAIGRGLAGSADDELLLADWLRIEWLGGSRAEAQRLVSRLTLQGRLDGLQQETRALLSTVAAGL